MTVAALAPSFPLVQTSTAHPMAPFRVPQFLQPLALKSNGGGCVLRHYKNHDRQRASFATVSCPPQDLPFTEKTSRAKDKLQRNSPTVNHKIPTGRKDGVRWGRKTRGLPPTPCYIAAAPPLKIKTCTVIIPPCMHGTERVVGSPLQPTISGRHGAEWTDNTCKYTEYM
jgi:hypothetical protein